MNYKIFLIVLIFFKSQFSQILEIDPSRINNCENCINESLIVFYTDSLNVQFYGWGSNELEAEYSKKEKLYLISIPNFKQGFTVKFKSGYYCFLNIDPLEMGKEYIFYHESVSINESDTSFYILPPPKKARINVNLKSEIPQLNFKMNDSLITIVSNEKHIFEVDSGLYNIKLISEELKPIEKTFDVQWDEDYHLSDTVVYKSGLIHIDGINESTELSLNGKNFDVKTVNKLEFERGRYRITIDKDRYEKIDTVVQVLPGKKTSINFTLIPNICKTTFTSNKNGTRVYINGRFYDGRYTPCTIDLKPGKYSILYRPSTDYFDRSFTIEVPKKEVDIVYKEVEKVPEGEIRDFVAIPLGGDYEIDQNFNGLKLRGYYQRTNIKVFPDRNFETKESFVPEIGLDYSPISIGISYGSHNNLTDISSDRDTLYQNDFGFINITFDYSPIVFFESIYPTVGFTYRFIRIRKESSSIDNYILNKKSVNESAFAFRVGGIVKIKTLQFGVAHNIYSENDYFESDIQYFLGFTYMF